MGRPRAQGAEGEEKERKKGEKTEKKLVRREKGWGGDEEKGNLEKGSNTLWQPWAPLGL